VVARISCRALLEKFGREVTVVRRKNGISSQISSPKRLVTEGGRKKRGETRLMDFVEKNREKKMGAEKSFSEEQDGYLFYMLGTPGDACCFWKRGKKSEGGSEILRGEKNALGTIKMRQGNF